jgi:hypothetical protein
MSSLRLNPLNKEIKSNDDCNVDSNDSNDSTFRITETDPSILLQCDSDKLTKSNLIYSLNDYPQVLMFLKICSILPPDYSSLKLMNVETIYIFYYYISRISFPLALIFCCLGVKESVGLAIYYSDDNTQSKFWGLYAFIIITFIISKLFSITAIYSLNKRLKKVCPVIDVPFYPKFTRFCYNYLLCSLFLVSFFPIALSYNYTSRDGLNGISLVTLIFFIINAFIDLFCMSANLLFICVDISICTTMISDLIVEFKNKTITISKINWVRQEIKTREESSSFLNNCLLITCLGNYYNYGFIFIYLFILYYFFKVNIMSTLAIIYSPSSSETMTKEISIIYGLLILYYFRDFISIFVYLNEVTKVLKIYIYNNLI